MNSNLQYSVNKQIIQLKDTLEKLYARYNHRRFIPPDPLQFVYRYSNRLDMEITALLSSVLAYGRVQQIGKNVNQLLALMPKGPAEFVANFDKTKRKTLKNFKHRFTSGDDISDLLAVLQTVLDRFANIENFFIAGYNSNDEIIIPALSKFCDSLLQIHASKHKGNVSNGLKYLLPRPAGGSACKRLNLFLRWMVRDDQVDTGLWQSVDKSKLIVPIDVHMGRLCRILGFYNNRTISLNSALKITNSFVLIEPDDPVKYDFALSRIGIVENCNGTIKAECDECDLLKFCSNR